MALPPALTSQRCSANFRNAKNPATESLFLKIAALLFSDTEDLTDARVAGKSVWVGSGEGAPAGNLGTNIRGLYLREDAATADTLLYMTVDGSTWTTVPALPLSLTDLYLASVGSVTITGAGQATFTGGANVVQGATNPDDLSDIAGIADGYSALMIAGTGVTNLVDSATLATPRNATIALAAGDRVLFIRSGTVHYAFPVFVQAGVPTSAVGPGTSDASATSVTVANSTDVTGVTAAGASTGNSVTGATVANSTDVTGVTAAGAATANSVTGATVANSTDVTGVTAAGAATANSVTGATVANSTEVTGVTAAGAATGSSGTETIGRLLPMPLMGAWAADGDGWTGGLVGDVVSLTLAAQAAAYAVVYDHGTTTYRTLSTSSGMGGGGIYTNDFQVFPDAETIDDAVYFGAALPFAEIGLPGTAVVGVYAGDSCVWEYYSGAGWSPIPAGAFYDSSSTTPTDGARPFTANAQRSLTIQPPSNWASTTVNGQAGYWVRSRVIAANITTPAVLADEHSVIVGEEPWRPPHAGAMTAITLCDNAATLHTGADMNLVLWDSTSGQSRSLTFHQDHRKERITMTSWSLTDAARLGMYVVQEDGTNEPTGVVAMVEYSLATTNHTHTAGAITITDAGHSHTATVTDAGHTHTAGAITVTDAGHTHTATVTDAGHTHTAGAITVTDAGHTHTATVTDAGHTHTAGAITVTDAGHTHTASVTDPTHTHTHGTTHYHNS